MQVTLSILEGPMKGKDKIFDEADIFIVGRMDDCHYFLSDDPYLSRHHFMLEINPPDIFIRDVGSLNGTFINGKKFGGRTKNQSSDPDAFQGESLALKQGDLITCGKTKMKVIISPDIPDKETPKKDGPRAEAPEKKPLAESVLPPKPTPKQNKPAAQPVDVSPPKQLQPVVAPVEKKVVPPPEKAKAFEAKIPPPKPAAKPTPKQNKPAARPVDVSPPQQLQPAAAPVEKKAAPPPEKAKAFEAKIPPPKPAAKPAPKKPDVPPGAAINILLKKLLQNAAAGKQEAFPEIKGYTILKKIGEGGFGAVYLAEKEKGKKKVALKMMLQQKAPSAKGVAMFNREIEVNRKLRHKNIIHVEDYFKSSDLHCFALEYMDAGSLWELMLTKGKLSLDDAVPIIIQSLEGLAFAHKKKIIHRDLKPPNILLSGVPKSYLVKLSDFGLAKNFAKAGMTKTNITVIGDVCGSPAYMAPEHITNYRFVTAPTDVFEMAATFYHILTGHIVWDIPNGGNCFQAILQGRIKPIAALNPQIPQTLSRIMDKALDREPAKRYENGADMLKAFKKAL